MFGGLLALLFIMQQGTHGGPFRNVDAARKGPRKIAANAPPIAYFGYPTSWEDVRRAHQGTGILAPDILLRSLGEHADLP